MLAGYSVNYKYLREMHEIVKYYRPSTTRETVVYNNSGEFQQASDYTTPFTYAEWLKRSNGIKIGADFESYNDYLKGWRQNKDKELENLNRIRQDYISFMKNIIKYIDGEDRKLFVDDINWDSLIDVEQVIPIVSRKLKEICLYIQTKRDAIKRSKLKYNLVGAEKSLERLFHEYILKAFTKRDTYFKINDSELYEAFPALKDVNTKLQIKINELYDDTEYMDKDPERNPLWYFGNPLENPEVSGFYKEMGYDDTNSIMWLFGTGFSYLSANYPGLYNNDDVNTEKPLSAYTDDTYTELSDYYKFKLSEKYIGNDIYTTSGISVESGNNEIVLKYDIQSGNNWIYLPSGENQYEGEDIQIEPFALSASTLSTEKIGYGSNNYRDSDKLFIWYGNTISGAWLKDVSYEWDDTIKMKLNVAPSASYSFKFPFAGFGVKGEGIEWSGPELSNEDSDFKFLDQSDQKSTLEEYWNTDTDLDIKPISIQSISTEGTCSSGSYILSNKITIRDKHNGDSLHDESPNGVYSKNMQRAFLYSFQNTNLPIRVGMNYINWPLQVYDEASKVIEVKNDICALNYPLSAINKNLYLVGAKAGNNLYDSDIIYKLDSRMGNPIECAYLTSKPFDSVNASGDLNAMSGNYQPGLSFRVNADEVMTFIWTDDETSASAVFSHISHRDDCPYTKLNLNDLASVNPSDEDPEVDYYQWRKCECGAIVYSPLGHKGDKITDFDCKCDFIFEDTSPSIPFLKSMWLDDEKPPNPYDKSTKFAWFKLDKDETQNVGWGKGQWVNTKDGKEFKFKKNTRYRYYRCSLGYDSTYLTNGCVPFLICNYQNTTSAGLCWKRAVLDVDGKWVETTETSPMVLNPNDSLVYDHIDKFWACKLCTIDDDTQIDCSIQMPSIGFSLNAGVSGRFWAEASDDEQYTHDKGICAWGGMTKLEDGYIPIIQPELSDITFTPNLSVTYENVGSSITWEQPLNRRITTNDRRWCKLNIDITKSNLEKFISNEKYKELSVTECKDDEGNDVTSDIIIKSKINGNRVLLNYWAKTPFTWEQPNVNIIKDITSEKEKWGEIDVAVESKFPYANLSNRHFPTIATVPVLENLYTKSKSGGYFIPSHLGVPIALTKNIVTEYLENSTQPSVFNNKDIYARDAGFAVPEGVISNDEMMNSSIGYIKDSAIWMKSPITKFYNSGTISEPQRYETFMPYKSRYDQRGENNIGIHRQDDTQDPWHGNEDKEWNTEIDYKPHFTKQQPIKRWLKEKKVYHNVQDFKVDLYGYSYALVKPELEKNEKYYSIYKKNNELLGDIVIRLKNNRICKLQEVITCLSGIIDGNVYDFDIIRNILIIRTEKRLVLYNLLYDFNIDKETFAEHNIIDSKPNMLILDGCYFAGVKKPSDIQKLYIPRIVGPTPDENDNKPIEIRVGVLDIDKFEYTEQDYGKIDVLNEFLKDKVITELCKPVASYNESTSILNVVMQIKYNYTCDGINTKISDIPYCKLIKCRKYKDGECALLSKNEKRACEVGVILISKINVSCNEINSNIIIPKNTIRVEK